MMNAVADVVPSTTINNVLDLSLFNTSTALLDRGKRVVLGICPLFWIRHYRRRAVTQASVGNLWVMSPKVLSLSAPSS